LSKEVFEANKAKGFHDTEVSNKTLLMLVITELSEAVEAHRKGRVADLEMFQHSCDVWKKHYPDKENKLFVQDFETYIKDSIEDELADTVIRLLDYAGRFNNNSKYPSNIDLSKAEGRNVSIDREEAFPDKIYEVVSWLTTTHGSNFGYVGTGIFLVEHFVICYRLIFGFM